MPLSCHLGMMECAVVSRHAWLVELEIQRDRGYHSASPHVISAGETDLTQMKCVTRRGFGNKTRQTVGKTNQNTTDTHTQTPALPHSVLWGSNTRSGIFLETAWVDYLFSVKITGNLKLPTPLSSLHPCCTYRCPRPSLIILFLHSFTT